jgi:hypothetical protein
MYFSRLLEQRSLLIAAWLGGNSFPHSTIFKRGPVASGTRANYHPLMARFTTRIQLNGEPSRIIYENLHIAMKKKGFVQTIKGGDGAEYQLPHGEYSAETDLSLAEVRDAARAAAKSVWADVEVLVTESAGRSWFLTKK